MMGNIQWDKWYAIVLQPCQLLVISPGRYYGSDFLVLWVRALSVLGCGLCVVHGDLCCGWKCMLLAVGLVNMSTRGTIHSRK